MGVAICAVIVAPGALIQPAAAQTVQAQGADTSSSRSFNIPAQPLTNALAQFGRQSGLQVVFPAQVSQGMRSTAVVGSFTPQQALAQLLAGTGIDWQLTREGATVGGQQAAASGGGAVTADGSTVLDTIVIAGRGDRDAASGSGYQGTPDWVYETPAAVSVISREAIQNAPSRNARDLLDNGAGVYANRSEAQNPGIAVNIRGLQDQDRIVTMIDGARQSFQRSGHGATQRTYVDTAFVRAVDIEKSSTSGAGSAGSLGGSVNFRTLVADDLIKLGRDWGVELNGTTGTNAFHFDGSVAAAFRISDSFSILGGISHKNIGAFDIGKNGDLKLSDGLDSDGALIFSGQEALSTILKAEADLTDDLKFTLGWVRSDSKFSTGGYSTIYQAVTEDTETVVNNTLTSALDWNPDSDLIDLKARFYYNHVKDNETKDWGIYNDVLGRLPVEYTMATIGGSLENTSRFDTRLGSLSLNYGVEAFHDDGKGEVDGEWINAYYQDASSALVGSTGTGKRTVASGFASATLEHDDWLTVQGGLRYDWHDISGSTTIYGNQTVTYHPPSNCVFYLGTECLIWGTDGYYEYGPYEQYNVSVDKSGGALLPSLTVAVKPFDGFQPFVKYAKSYRPPTVMESFLNGGHGGTSINSFAPNPYLEPERADTFEIGFNASLDGLFKADDSFRLKVVGFYREVEDYITFGRHYNFDASKYYTSYVNLDGTTRMKGVEVEANYDARAFYVGASLTYNKTDWADTFTFNGPSGGGTGSIQYEGPTVLFVQPELRVAIDGGVRFFEEKLTLGGRVTHVSATKPTLGTLLPESTFGMGAYTIFDVYGSYAFNENTKLRFAVTNLTDVAYAPAVGASYYAAPGRTATVSLNLKF